MGSARRTSTTSCSDAAAADHHGVAGTCDQQFIDPGCNLRGRANPAEKEWVKKALDFQQSEFDPLFIVFWAYRAVGYSRNAFGLDPGSATKLQDKSKNRGQNLRGVMMPPATGCGD